MEDQDQTDWGHRATYGSVEDNERMSAEEMDERRKQNIAYEYLCHLEEAKVWIEACINDRLPETVEVEEGLRNGVYLAKLGHFMKPELVPLKRIYDKDQERYKARGLHFRHTDNVNHWLRAMESLGLPQIFYPETTDIYDRKNMPRVIYCIHALSLYMFKLGLAPQIEDLYGKIKFTEEEISAMRMELEKYGIQMPAFSKIGGILANEMPVDEAALHAAVIAINEAIDKGMAGDTLAALKNPAAHLVNVQNEYSLDYQELLSNAKETKAENARNKSLDPDYEPDVYDELLTQAEIQGNVNKVNTIRMLDRINDALDKNDEALLMQTLQSPLLNLKDVQEDKGPFYMMRLRNDRETKKNNNNGEAVLLDKDEVQNGVLEANKEADTEYQKALAVGRINSALNGEDPTALLAALKDPKAQLSEVYDFAANLYFEEFINIKEEKEDDLDFDEIYGGVRVLSSIAQINQAIDAGDPSQTFTTLLDKNAHIQGLDEMNQKKYQEHLAAAKLAKQGESNELLTHFEIQESVDAVNTQVQEEHERILAIGVINEAIDKGDPQGTLTALQMPTAKLTDIEPQQAIHYQNLLAKEKENKAKTTDDESAQLWLEEIQACIKTGNRHAVEGNKMSVGVTSINLAIDDGIPSNLLTQINNPDVNLHSVIPDCADGYLKKLQEAKAEKEPKGECGSGWMMNRAKEGHKFYFNTNTMETAWERPDGVVKDHSLLTKEEIQVAISEVSAQHDRELLFQANEPMIVRLQANIRGYQARKAFNERMDFMKKQLPAIVKIQAWYRGQKQRQNYQNRLKELKDNEESVVKIQAKTRMMLARKKYNDRKDFFKKHEDEIIKIQAAWRANMAKQDYMKLMHADAPPVAVVRKFVHLLDQSDIDYSEEIELQKLRAQVVTEIRSNGQLEHDLDQMDIKIGLLVKNRITLQDVISHDRKLKHYKENPAGVVSRGLKSLSKESRERLEAYQHLFYLLQTNPTYLAKLIFEMPQSRTTKFMESVILTLYNYASNQREEYLLLKLFKTALEEEIRRGSSKVDKMSDIVTGNPMVVKMIVGFNRNTRGQSSLRELLNPLVKKVIEDRKMQINTNPVEVYKAWVNQQESETGQASGLPYDVTSEQALEHEEVRNRIDQSVSGLRQATDMFLQHILGSLDKIPYGMRYMAKVLKMALHEKFPDAPEKDVLKIVGNLIYYRYINSAIVAPDAFDIIDVSADKGLSNDQRRNLGSVAKILQFAASNKGFGGDSAHLSTLNNYIREAHEKFKKFFREACNVEEPEVRFNMDQYTDVTMVTKPVIYISIQEIINTHQLLLEHQDTIAPDHNDPLHELVEDLGDNPDIEALIGDLGADESNKAQVAKTEISLTLSNKFEVAEDDQSDTKTLLIRTKRMIVDVIRCQPGDTLTQILNTPATDEQEEEHVALMKKREIVDRRATSKDAKIIRQQSIMDDSRLPLEGQKAKIKKNLHTLVLANIVSHKDHYQAIINMIVQDIRNQRRYRQRRKQEMMRIKETLQRLGTKRAFYEEQIDYYNRYVKTCLDNLSKKGKKSKNRFSLFGGKDSDVKAAAVVKYSAAKLHEKGVILEIEGLPTNQFKNVLFEIGSTEDPGVFDVNAKFMGVQMDKVELVFQDLLQLQYEGVAVMKMFDRAKVNVNLLIFLLNKKFYGKK